ncbi:MAG: hypothetical protein JXR13_13800 [Thalassovita sp.]
MKKLVLAATAALSLAGCAQPAAITRAPAAAALTGHVSKDKLAKGTRDTFVRAYTVDAQTGKRTEVVGATCELRSDELAARVITPQAVVLPKFKQSKDYEDRGKPSDLVVTCSDEGLKGTTAVAAEDKSASTATGGGIAAALIVAAVSVAAARSEPWDYPANIKVDLK